MLSPVSRAFAFRFEFSTLTTEIHILNWKEAFVFRFEFSTD